MSELQVKPCPFCGSEHVLLRHEFGRTYYVRCLHCGLFSKFEKTPEDAIEAWNRERHQHE